jgi:hypothetical protein
MPAWIKTDKEEEAWQKAKEKYKENKNVSNNEDEWEDKDWATITKVAKNILKKEEMKLSNLLSKNLDEDE